MDEMINVFEFSVFINKNELGKMNFPLGKIAFWTNLELCAYHKIFDF